LRETAAESPSPAVRDNTPGWGISHSRLSEKFIGHNHITG
jgi:hypothetical protein